MSSSLTLPTRSGWIVEWFTGNTITHRGKVIKLCDSFESTSKQKVEAKAEELKRKGFEVIGISECIF